MKVFSVKTIFFTNSRKFSPSKVSRYTVLFFLQGKNFREITVVLQKQIMQKHVSLKPTSASCSRAYCMDLTPFSSYTVWTHTLTTWTAANWTEKDGAVGPTNFIAVLVE